MTTTSGGNLSIREDNGDIWITPARLDKGSLRRDDIVCVRADGAVLGPHRPSSELPFHQEIYRTRRDIHGIVHAHPVALVAFSLVHRIPDTRLFHQTRLVCGEAGFAPYELPGSLALGRNVAAIFGQGFDCVLLENHGAVTGGANLQEAFRRFETLEFTAKTIIKARMLGEVRYLTDDEIAHRARLRPRVDRLPAARTQHAREGTARAPRRVRAPRLPPAPVHQHARQFLRARGRRQLSDHALPARTAAPSTFTTSCWCATASAKPAASPAAPRACTTRSTAGIQSMGAIINAYPVNATAFSVTGEPLDSRTIPESYIVIREVSRFPYGLQFSDTAALAAAISPRRPAAILENDGVLVTGGDILEAFDRLEVLESTAEAIINCHTVGTLAPMPEAVTRELDRVFLGE